MKKGDLMRPIDADKLKQTISELDAESSDIKAARIMNITIQEFFPQIIDDEPTLCVVPAKEICKLRDNLQKIFDNKWKSFERCGCSNRYLLGKAHAYSIVVDMINDLLKDNLGDD